VKTVRLTSFTDGRQCLSYYVDGKRRRETFLNLREAQRRKAEIERMMGKGLQVESTEEAAQDASVQYALSQLERNGIQKPLSAVIDEYIAATLALKGAGTLQEASEAFSQKPSKIIPRKISDLVADYNQYLIGQKVGDLHRQKTVGIYLKKFAAAFQMDIHLVTLRDLETWRATFTTTGRTVNNYFNAVKTLFNYAKDRNHLPVDRPTEASKIKDTQEDPTEANPFTIEEMAILLTTADEKSLPYIVIGAFAGIRTAELRRLTWENNVDWDQGIFDLNGKLTKVRVRRAIPILPVAEAWLAPYKKQKGLIIQEKHPERYPTTLLEKHKLEWRHNGLRDAFGSNRCAILEDVGKVSYEMGNSPAMVFNSYRKVVTKKEAEKFWDLTPANAKKIAAEYINKTSNLS